MDVVHTLGGEITISVIAHRLTTVRECGCIYLLEQRRVVGRGSYQELSDKNKSFRTMASGV